MISFILRHKTGLTFILIVVVLVSTIAGQVPAPSHPSLLAWTIYAVVSPIQHAVSYLVVGVSSLWEDYLDLRTVRDENKALKKSLIEQYRENQQLNKKLEILQGLSATEEERRKFEEETGYRSITAMVIGAGVDNQSHAFILNRGTLDGVEEDMGVVCHTGVVGRIIRVGPTTCLVQLLTDPNFAMAARLKGSGVRALLHGAGRGECELLYIRRSDAVDSDDEVMASGTEGIFPSGIPIGVVSRVGRGDPPFRRVFVRPFTDFRTIEWVIIMGVESSGEEVD